MLVLTRKIDESIVVGNNIHIKILKVHGNQVHLGIEAPKDISVYRSEVFEQIKKENVKAVQKSDGSDKIKLIEENLNSLRELLTALPSSVLPNLPEVPTVSPEKKSVGRPKKKKSDE